MESFCQSSLEFPLKRTASVARNTRLGVFPATKSENSTDFIGYSEFYDDVLNKEIMQQPLK